MDKIIVSNRAALATKYGSAGVAKIKAAVSDLIAADAKRGVKSRLVYLDDAVAMKSFKGRGVTDASSPRQNKEAIDAIFRAADPDGFFIGEWRGEPVACLSAVAYGEDFGFIGLYIVKQAFRGRGFGMRVWGDTPDAGRR